MKTTKYMSLIGSRVRSSLCPVHIAKRLELS